MTVPGTSTLTRIGAVTIVDVRHVLWRIQSDLRVLRAYHGMITSEREGAIATDLTTCVYRGFVDQFEFLFVDRTLGTASHRVRYAFTRERVGSQDDASGGLQYQNLTNAEFTVVVAYSTTWQALSPADKEAFSSTLLCAWGPAAAVSDGAGYWTSDRTYGSGGLGAARSVFRAY
ncbi:MAG: hypothetical protein ACREA0_03540 [bacterium]